MTIRSTRAESQPQPSLAFSEHSENVAKQSARLSDASETLREGKILLSERSESSTKRSGLFSECSDVTTSLRRTPQSPDSITSSDVYFYHKGKEGKEGDCGVRRNDGNANTIII